MGAWFSATVAVCAPGGVGSWTVGGMIRDISISAKGAGDDAYYEPPARVLSLAVIGGDAHLAIYDHGPVERAAGPVATIEVPPARCCWP